MPVSNPAPIPTPTPTDAAPAPDPTDSKPVNPIDASPAPAPDPTDAASADPIDPAPPTDAPTALPTDAATAKLVAQDDKAMASIVTLAVATLDPRDALKKYARLGAEVLKHARWQKAQFPAWTAGDFRTLCDRTATQVKFLVPIRKVECDVYVRTHLLVEMMKGVTPAVAIDRVSYHQIVNKFLPCVRFDAVELTAEWAPGWGVWAVQAISRQASTDPLSLADLDAALVAQRAEIAKERDGEKTAEQIEERDRKAAEAQARKGRRDALASLGKAADAGLASGELTAVDLVQVVEAIAKDHGVTLPNVGPNPATMTATDARVFAAALWSAGNAVAIKTLHGQLSLMVKMLADASIATAAPSVLPTPTPEAQAVAA